MAILRRAARFFWNSIKPETGDGALCLKATLWALAITVPFILIGELIQWLAR